MCACVRVYVCGASQMGVNVKQVFQLTNRGTQRHWDDAVVADVDKKGLEP